MSAKMAPRLLCFGLATLGVHAADTTNLDMFGNVVSGTWATDSNKHWGPHLIDSTATQPKCLKPLGGCAGQPACTVTSCPCKETAKYANSTKGAGYIGVNAKRDWLSADIVGEIFNIVATEMVGQPMVYRDVAGRSSANLFDDIEIPADTAGYSAVSTPCADCAALDCSLPGAAAGCDTKKYDINGQECSFADAPTNSISVDANGYSMCDVATTGEKDVCAMVGAPMVSGAKGCSMGLTPVWQHSAGACTASATQSCGTEDCCKTKYDWCKASFAICRDTKFDLDIESWRMDSSEDKYKKSVLIDKKFDHTGPIGFLGQETLYYAPETWASTQRPLGRYPEFYKAYQRTALTNQYSQIGLADNLSPSAGGDGKNCADMQEEITLGGDASAEGYGDKVYRCNDAGRFIPPWCQNSTAPPTSKASDSYNTTCREIYGAKTSWSSGLFENFILGYELPFVFKWLGSDFFSRYDLLQNATTVANPGQVFYGWTPHPSMTKLGARPITMKPWETGCGDGISAPQAGKKLCEKAATQLGKVSSNRFKARAVEAYATLQRMTISEQDIQNILGYTTAGGGSYTGAWDPACEWIKQNIGKVEDWVVEFGNCPAGSFYDRANDKCELAPAGTYVDRKGMDVAIPCKDGYHSAAAGATACTACGKGTFMAADRKSCSPCAIGSFTDSTAATTCSPCPKGTFAAAEGTAECSRCAFGSFTSTTGNSECVSCAAATGKNDQTTVFSSSKDVNDCVCKEGTFLSGQTNSCEACPEGLVCPAGSDPATSFGKMDMSLANESDLPQMHVQDGFYIEEVKDPFDVYVCDILGGIPGGPCAGGPPRSCRDGREGLACGRCPENEYLKDGDACAKCEAGDEALVPLFFVIVAFVAVMPYYFINEKVQSAMGPFTVVAVSFGSLITTMQASIALSRVSVQWPATLAAMWDVISVVAFDLKMLKVDCFISSENAVGGYAMMAFFPACVVAWMFLFGALTRLVFSENSFWRQETSKIANSVGTIYKAMFISLFFLVIQPLRCFKHPNGKKSVVRYPFVVCEGSEHGEMIGIFVVVLLCFVVSFVAAYAYHMYHFPTYTEDANMKLLQAIKFMHYHYRPRNYWFGLIYIANKVLIGCASLMDPEQPFVQLMAIQTVLISYSIVTAYLWPWKTPALNFLDITQMTSVGFMVTSASPLLNANVDPVMRDRAVGASFFFFFMAVGTTFAFMALVIFQVVKERMGTAANENLLDSRLGRRDHLMNGFTKQTPLEQGSKVGGTLEQLEKTMSTNKDFNKLVARLCSVDRIALLGSLHSLEEHIHNEQAREQVEAAKPTTKSTTVTPAETNGTAAPTAAQESRNEKNEEAEKTSFEV